jgi:hypothetical protein
MKRRDILAGLLLTAVCRADAREHGKPNRVAFVAPLHEADISETGDFGPSGSCGGSAMSSDRIS